MKHNELSTKMKEFTEDRNAIARLYIRGFIGEAAKKQAYKRLEKIMAKYNLVFVLGEIKLESEAAGE